MTHLALKPVCVCEQMKHSVLPCYTLLHLPMTCPHSLLPALRCSPLMHCLAVWHLAHIFPFMHWLLLPFSLPTSVVYSCVMPDQVRYELLGVQFLPMIDVIIPDVLVCVNRKEVFVIVDGLVANCVPFDSCGAFNTLHPCVGYCSPTPLFRRQQPFQLGGYTAESE